VGILAAEPSVGVIDWVLRVAIVGGLVGLTYLSLSSHVFRPLVRSAERHRWVRLLERPSMLWALMGSLLLGFRTFLWFRYRPFPAAHPERAPHLTVIIPAYNEGPMVAHSIDSVARARYPRERLEIFVVDDGSRDDTWVHIEAAAARHPGVVTALKFEQNRGKRAALEAGFRRAKGEVVVTIDSDSTIEPDTLLAIAGPFRDPKVGAVAGKVVVLNRREGVIPRMLQTRYVLSFDLLRAVQSTYRTVYCCPGALTGYRVSVVRDVLDAWMAQTFLGAPCTYGEDRSMTNFMLDRGFDTVYQRTAVVHTVVPLTYRKLCKMFLRWDRSYVREELRLARIVWKRPAGARLIAVWDLIITNLRYPVTYASLILLVFLVLHDPVALLRILFAIGVLSAFNMLYYVQSERSGDVVYGILYAYYAVFALFWIFPYAVLTVRSRSWMTR
jgi:hyaluronan synthase